MFIHVPSCVQLHTAVGNDIWVWSGFFLQYKFNKKEYTLSMSRARTNTDINGRTYLSFAIVLSVFLFLVLFFCFVFYFVMFFIVNVV